MMVTKLGAPKEEPECRCFGPAAFALHYLCSRSDTMALYTHL
jgi:hypothetical protein